MNDSKNDSSSQAGPSAPKGRVTGDDRLSSYLESIPDELFINIASRLDLPSLMSLETNRELRSRVNTLGIPTYLIQHPFPHLTLHPPVSQWSPSSLVRYNHRISHQISRRKWHAAQIGPAWPSAVIPVMELTQDRLFVGAGGKLVVYPLSSRSRSRSQYRQQQQAQRDERDGDGNTEAMVERGSKVLNKETVYNVTKKMDGSRGDIIGLAPLIDGQVIVAQFDGTIQRLSLGTGPNGGGVWRSTVHYASPSRSGIDRNGDDTNSTSIIASGSGSGTGNRSAINTFSHDGDSFMITTSSPNPCAMIYSARSPWVDPIRVHLPGTEPRAWSSSITTTSKYLGPSMMLGLSSKIAIYDYPHSRSTSSHSSSTSSNPTRTLTGPDPPSRSSAYDTKLPPPGSAHHPSLLLSAWFDSHLRLHDLRSPSPEAVVEFSDPWIWADGSAMYSCAWFGEYGIAGGGARHGTVCLFDIRKSDRGGPGGTGGPGHRASASRRKQQAQSTTSALTTTMTTSSSDPRSNLKDNGNGGWSVFTPGGKGSPVYSLRGEGGRIWGVTEKRAFVLAFDGSGDRPEGLLSREVMNDLQNEGAREKEKAKAAAQTRGRGRNGHGHGEIRGRGSAWAQSQTHTRDQTLSAAGAEDGNANVPGLKSTGYQHSHKSVDLFESLPLA